MANLNDKKAPKLTEKQATYVKERSRGKGRDASAIVAGYAESDGVGKQVEESTAVQVALQAEANLYADAGGVTKEEVMEGMKEAINMARIIADPQSMIRGWAEVAKLCGYYAPEKKQVNVNVRGSGLMKRLENLTDEELLKLSEGKIIDVTPTAVTVEPDPQP